MITRIPKSETFSDYRALMRIGQAIHFTALDNYFLAYRFILRKATDSALQTLRPYLECNEEVDIDEALDLLTEWHLDWPAFDEDSDRLGIRRLVEDDIDLVQDWINLTMFDELDLDRVYRDRKD